MSHKFANQNQVFLPLWAAIKLADFYEVTLDYLVERESAKK